MLMLYRIGEFSKLTGISIRTLRYYDSIDLFKPSEVDLFTNYRYYKEEQVKDLELINELKEVGFTVEEMRDNWNNFSEELFLKRKEKLLEEIELKNEARKKADIYDVIMNLDDKFNTFVGEGGVMLSGGEKQRLAIARTLLTKSNIILFDEATSALDNVTQDKVQKAIYGLDKNKTILIIAHRLSTVNKYDRIVVVDKGNIVDIGTHKELYKRCSKYRELYDCEIV